MSNSNVHYMRCKIPRLDTDEDRDFEYQCYPSTSTADPVIRKQSRISKVRMNVPRKSIKNIHTDCFDFSP